MQNKSLYTQFLSSKQKFGSLKAEWNPSAKGVEFQFSLTNLAPNKPYELVLLNDANFLEGQLFVQRFNPLDAVKHNCFYEKDSQEFYLGDIGLFEANAQGKIQSSFLKKYITMEDTLGRPIVIKPFQQGECNHSVQIDKQEIISYGILGLVDRSLSSDLELLDGKSDAIEKPESSLNNSSERNSESIPSKEDQTSQNDKPFERNDQKQQIPYQGSEPEKQMKFLEKTKQQTLTPPMQTFNNKSAQKEAFKNQAKSFRFLENESDAKLLYERMKQTKPDQASEKNMDQFEATKQSLENIYASQINKELKDSFEANPIETQIGILKPKIDSQLRNKQNPVFLEFSQLMHSSQPAANSDISD